MIDPENLEKVKGALIPMIQSHHFSLIPSGSEIGGNRIFIRYNNNQVQECLIKILNLDLVRNIKIPKSEFNNQIKSDQWIILGLIIEQSDPVFYMIPMPAFRHPNNWLIDNSQPERLNHFDNWEIKVFVKMMPELNPYRLESILPGLKS